MGFIGQSQFTGIFVFNGYTVSLDRLFIHRVNQCRKKLRIFVRGRRGISVYIVR